MASPAHSSQSQQRTSRSTQRSSSQRARSQSPSASSATDRSDPTAFPKPVAPRRAVSSPEVSLQCHRIRIQYSDEALRLRSLENAAQLMQIVAMTELKSASPLTNNEILARKALKYRKVLDRMHDVDVHDPTFDASAFLGVEWCKRSAVAPAVRRSYALSA